MLVSTSFRLFPLYFFHRSIRMPDRFVRYAVKSASYLVLNVADTLTRARRLVVSAPLTAADGGDGGDFTLGVNPATPTDRGVIKLAGQLGGEGDLPDVRGLRITGGDLLEGPQLLSIGAVKDGEALTRSNGFLVGMPTVKLENNAVADNLPMGGNRITGLGSGVGPADAVTMGQLAAMSSGLLWQEAVIDGGLVSAPSGPNTKDRYIVGDSPSGAWTGHGNELAEWNGSAWVFTTPTTGFTVHVELPGIDVHYNGTVWISMGSSVDHSSLLNLGSGNPHGQYQLVSLKDNNNGYAGLDPSGFVIRPVAAIRTGADPAGSPPSGQVWINGPELKYRDAQGTPQTHSVESQSRRNQNNGYAGLSPSGRIEPAQAPPKATYTTGGAQAITPSDIGAATSTRAIVAGPGLQGGGSLSADRTLSIVAFTGLVTKDFEPEPLTWTAGEMKTHLTLDVGAGGQLLPWAVRIPPAVVTALRPQVVFVLDNNFMVVLENLSDTLPLEMTFQGLLDLLGGNLGGPGQNNGRCVQKIMLQTRNSTTGSTGEVNLSTFRVRAWASPRGAGLGL